MRKPKIGDIVIINKSAERMHYVITVPGAKGKIISIVRKRYRGDVYEYEITFYENLSQRAGKYSFPFPFILTYQENFLILC